LNTTKNICLIGNNNIITPSVFFEINFEVL
jgi:hypothetical protein